MSDQVTSLTKEPAIFQLGLPPGNGSTSCTDCCVAMIVRHETGRTVTARQVRSASGNSDVDTGLTPGQALAALRAYGVHDYVYVPGPTPSDVLLATDLGLVLTGVGYWAYPSTAQCEVGGKNDFGFGGPHAILVAGRRYWSTKPSFWTKSMGTFVAGWRFWARDPDHSQGWRAKYDRASTSWLIRAMGALIGLGSPPWQNTFMIAKGVTLRAMQLEEPGYDTPIDQPTAPAPAHTDSPE